MAWTFKREDVKKVRPNVYQLGPVEFEISPGSQTVQYQNIETMDSGPATIDDLKRDFGQDVASFFKERLEQA